MNSTKIVHALKVRRYQIEQIPYLAFVNHSLFLLPMKHQKEYFISGLGSFFIAPLTSLAGSSFKSL
jgi:hypothetical protein